MSTNNVRYVSVWGYYKGHVIAGIVDRLTGETEISRKWLKYADSVVAARLKIWRSNKSVVGIGRRKPDGWDNICTSKDFWKITMGKHTFNVFAN